MVDGSTVKRPRLARPNKTRHHQRQTEARTEEERNRQRTMGAWGGRGGHGVGEGGTPGWGGSTIFLFCVVKLGWIPPARPPFTEPLEEILLLVPAVLRPYSATFRQLHCTSELHLNTQTHPRISAGNVDQIKPLFAQKDG